MSLVVPNEETPLLPEQQKRKRTPLPMGQISIVLLLLLAEPITSVCIYPFINQLVAELDITGGDETKVGYYAGLIESLFFAAEACTILWWSRLSDRIGRKPVVTTGLIGIALSMICFGLSRTFWRLVVSRCLAGLLNGNVGVLSGMIGDLTDSTNMAHASAMIPVVWSVGVAVGPLIGGQLSQPYERFPETFGRSEFWKHYPYFLPCAVSATFSILTVIISLLFLKEPHASRPSDKDVIAESDSNRTPQDAPSPQDDGIAVPPHIPSSRSKPLPMRSLMTPRVLSAVLNYAILAFIDSSFRALQPLFYATSTELGGLGLSPPTIGVCLGAVGVLNGVFQACFFTRIYHRLGIKRVFLTAMATFVPIFAAFPLINLLARHQGMTYLTWSILVLQMALIPVMDMAYSCCFMYVTSAAPTKYSLGATHGLAQTASSVVRAVGPAAATSLFAVSIQLDLLGGWFVYVIFIIASLSALSAASLLPREALREEHHG